MSERERREQVDRRDRSYRRRSRSASRSREREINPRARSRSPRRPRDRSPHPTTHRSERRQRSKSRSRSDSRSRSKRSGKKRERRSASSSSSEDEGHRSRRKERRKDRSRSKERGDRKPKKKKEKKHKKEKDKLMGSSTALWGKYGIINESNMFDKQAEFHTWLIEERMINPETVTKETTKKEFARYMEDYNTATLPHEKYYNMSAFEQRMTHVRNGETITVPDEGYNLSADFAAHHSALKAGPSSTKDVHLSKEQVQELRRVQNERMQIGRMKLLGMDIKQNFGVRMDETMQEDL